MLSRPLQHAWHWSITQIVEHSLSASHNGFANSCWNVWQCGRRDTRQARGWQPGHYRRGDLRRSSLAIGTARGATFEEGIIVILHRIRGPEHEHPRKDRIDNSRHHADRRRASMVAEPAQNARHG